VRPYRRGHYWPVIVSPPQPHGHHLVVSVPMMHRRAVATVAGMEAPE
jgi:hypothetical protein